MTRRIEDGVTYDQFFDVENRLILVNPLTGESTGFFYDAAGQRVKTLKPDGTLIYTPYPTYEEEVRPTITFQADFENSGQMSEVKSSAFPMSSLWRGSSSTAYPASGAFGYSLSNHAYGHIQSDPIAVSANTQYDLYAWVRGQLDPDDRAGAWIIRARYYNSSGDSISYKDIASGNENSINTTWQEKGGRITTPAGTATLRIQLYNYSNSGWVAFDDVRLNPVGSGTNLVANPGFESSSSWSGIASTAYPGTSLWRGTIGNAAPHSGSYSYSISNLAYGSLRSDAIAVTANTQYDLYAWLRGEIDTDVNTGVSKWIMRVLFYNSSGGYLNYADADSGNPGTLSTNWQQEGGRITTPANTASVRIELFNYLNSGWVAFDDVSFIKVGTGTNLAPNPGFESSGSWSETPSAAFPGTGFVRSTSGIGGPRSGSYGYSISNHAYAYLQSGNLPVTGGAQYDLYAWVRGKLDADDSASNFYIRFRFYDSSGAAIPYDSAHNAYSGSPESLDGVWRYTGGRVTAPANAATAQILLLSHYNTGWLAFDDVLLTRVGQETVIKRSSYGAVGQMIATRVTGDPVSGNNGLFFIYSDHLGSASLLVNNSNNPVVGSRTWYLPFGGYRPGSAPTQTITDRDFTGQRENMELGLLYYGARFYVPGLGRFASADTVIPNPTSPQSYNRYAYVLNRPMTHT